MLVERAGETVLKDELLAEVWEGAAVEENNLTQCISTLRKVLGEKRGENRYILTDPGKGYRFVAAVTEIDRMPAALESKPPSEPNMQREGRWRRSTAVIAAGVVLFFGPRRLALFPGSRAEAGQTFRGGAQNSRLVQGLVRSVDSDRAA